MTTTIEEARKVKKVLVDQLLLKDFNSAARLPVNGVGLGRDADGYFVKVNLERELTEKETAKLPESRDNVRIKYDVTGPITAH